MNRRTAVALTVTLVALSLASLLVACGGAQGEVATPPTPDGKVLVEARCAQCHDLGLVERARKTEAAWKATVERMVAKGAKLDEEEQALVIQYLAETYPQ